MEISVKKYVKLKQKGFAGYCEFSRFHGIFQPLNKNAILPCRKFTILHAKNSEEKIKREYSKIPKFHKSSHNFFFTKKNASIHLKKCRGPRLHKNRETIF